MTICISCKYLKEDGTHGTLAASDSEVSVGEKRLLGISGSDNKMVSFPGAVVSMSGNGCVYEALLMLREDEKFSKRVQFRTRKDIREFALNFSAQYKHLTEQATIDANELTVGVLVIATPDKIWSVFCDLSIFEHEYFYYTGSGGATALGLLTHYNPSFNKEELRDFLVKTIQTVSVSDLGCGGQVKVWEVEAPNPPPSKKKRKKLTVEPTNDKIQE